MRKRLSAKKNQKFQKGKGGKKKEEEEDTHTNLHALTVYIKKD